MCIYLKIRAIVITAKDCSTTWGSKALSLIINNTVPAIAHREIKPTIRPTGNPVQIVSLKTNPYSEAIYQFMMLLGFPIIILID